MSQQTTGQGDDTFTSCWFEIDQARIDAFADVTEDHQAIHIDPEVGAKSPFKSTIAHGFLTLSMLSAMAYDALPPETGVVMGVNYGFDRVRFTSPVPAGCRVRAHFTLIAREETQPGEISTTHDVSVEVEGQERPALVARWLGRRYLAAT